MNLCAKCGDSRAAHHQYKKRGREVEECLTYRKGHWCRCDGFAAPRARGQIRVGGASSSYERQSLK